MNERNMFLLVLKILFVQLSYINKKMQSKKHNELCVDSENISIILKKSILFCFSGNSIKTLHQT